MKKDDLSKVKRIHIFLNVTATALNILLVIAIRIALKLFEGFDSIVSAVSRPHDTLEAESWWHIPSLSSQLLLSVCDSSCSSRGLRCAMIWPRQIPLELKQAGGRGSYI